MREGARGTELCFLSLLRLLFKLLWKTVMYWVDPAAFVQHRLQTEILLSSDNHFEKQNKRIEESFLLVQNLLYRMISFPKVSLDWICWKGQPALHTKPQCPGNLKSGLCTSLLRHIQPPCQKAGRMPVTLCWCSVPAVC